ncbi:MAG: hypothetical protein JWL66_1965 [Sphingomonadales bacterium]|nr:hypothetical protein [Sphingomonadales bacterium]
MNQWSFVTAAYVIAIGGTTATTLWAYIAMRRAERDGPKDSGR